MVTERTTAAGLILFNLLSACYLSCGGRLDPRSPRVASSRSGSACSGPSSGANDWRVGTPPGRGGVMETVVGNAGALGGAVRGHAAAGAAQH